MSQTWAKNLIGIRQSDFELLQVPNPTFELGVHITLKCVEASTLVGSIGYPLMKLLTDSNLSPCDLKSAMVSGGIRGAAFGLIAGPIMTAITASRLSDIGVFDRCYRLRFNSEQLFVDRSVIVASTVGAAMNGPTGFVLGMDIALVGSFLVNKLFSK